MISPGNSECLPVQRCAVEDCIARLPEEVQRIHDVRISGDAPGQQTVCLHRCTLCWGKTLPSSTVPPPPPPPPPVHSSSSTSNRMEEKKRFGEGEGGEREKGRGAAVRPLGWETHPRRDGCLSPVEASGCELHAPRRIKILEGKVKSMDG